MSRTWTFGQRLGAGFAVVVLLAVAMGAIAVYAIRSVVAGKDRVIEVNAVRLVDAQRLIAATDARSAAARGFVITGDDMFLSRLGAADVALGSALDGLQSHGSGGNDRLLSEIRDAARVHENALHRLLELRRSAAPAAELSLIFVRDVLPPRDALGRLVDVFVAREQNALDASKQAASNAAQSAVNLVAVIAILTVLVATGIAAVLTRTLTRQIGTAVQDMQASATELQAAASQQATGSKQQSTAMAEITTTMTELLATSRQIAESARRVAHIANETATAARAGDATMTKAADSVGGIKRQVDAIVVHMLDLGRKSQQIGGILEIINELSEQTNILAINATIEAAGAGDAGRRFGVVADEIRRLADRVGGSTKDIRGLIDEIRAAVNTTVMATENGTKAVDAGSRQFSDVATALTQISGLVGTTTDAAREIELSTKQQSTAVEQVNLAVADVAQATKESEVSSGQTLQTASVLTTLSRDLRRLVQPEAQA